ncbi:glyoxalase family protein, partial [Penicillium canescens]
PNFRFQECLKIYLAALKPLGYEARRQFGETVVALGSTFDEGNCPPADFWVIGTNDPTARIAHLAFRAPDRKSVDASHDNAINAGSRDNGKPGLRTSYHPNYYGAFVIDAAGNNIEAVCHNP